MRRISPLTREKTFVPDGNGESGTNWFANMAIFLEDGANVAARLEGIATPGGICISEQSQNQRIAARRAAAKQLVFVTMGFAKSVMLSTSSKGRPEYQ